MTIEQIAGYVIAITGLLSLIIVCAHILWTHLKKFGENNNPPRQMQIGAGSKKIHQTPKRKSTKR